MSNKKKYFTERLYLRAVEEGDAGFIFELLNTPKWLKFIGNRNVKSIENAKEYIRTKMVPQQLRLGYGNYVVIQKETSLPIGTCGLYDREGLEGIDIGFAFLPNFEQKGYAFEAASLIRDLGFNEFGIGHISAITTKENKASQRLLEKLGLEFIKYTKLPDSNETLLYYSLKKDDICS